MTVLLTGGTGFVGSYVLKAILAQTNEQVVLLKRSSSDVSRIADELHNPRLICYDVDKTILEDIFKKHAIQTIIHIATEYGRGENPEVKVLETNLMFPIRLIDVGLKYGLKTFINTDSYFNKEGLSYNYLLHYSLSKKSLLLWLKYYAGRMTVINLALEHPYGAFDGKAKFTEQMIRQIAIEKIPQINLTAGEQKRDFIYVKDVANAYIAALDFATRGKPSFYNFEIGTGQAVSIRHFVQTVKQVSGSNTQFNYGVIAYRADEIMCSVADTSNHTLLNWKPNYTLENALKEIIDIYQGATKCHS